jgi:hypothetical protein
LKTEGSSTPIPIPQELALLLSASVQRYPSDFMVTNGPGADRAGPWLIERAVRHAEAAIAESERDAKKKVLTLPGCMRSSAR